MSSKRSLGRLLAHLRLNAGLTGYIPSRVNPTTYVTCRTGVETTEPALWLPVGPQRPQKYHRKALDEPDKSVAGDRSRSGRRRHSTRQRRDLAGMRDPRLRRADEWCSWLASARLRSTVVMRKASRGSAPTVRWTLQLRRTRATSRQTDRRTRTLAGRA